MAHCSRSNCAMLSTAATSSTAEDPSRAGVFCTRAPNSRGSQNNFSCMRGPSCFRSAGVSIGSASVYGIPDPAAKKKIDSRFTRMYRFVFSALIFLICGFPRSTVRQTVIAVYVASTLAESDPQETFLLPCQTQVMRSALKQLMPYRHSRCQTTSDDPF